MTPQPTILIYGASTPADVPGLTTHLPGYAFRCVPEGGDLAGALPGAEVILGWKFNAKELQSSWSNAKQVKWVHWCGAGVDAALFPELASSDVILTNARGLFDDAMAEYAAGLVIGLAKGFWPMFKAQEERRWGYAMTETVAGKRALIVGAGSIGTAMGAKLRALNMEVEGIARTARPGDDVFSAIGGMDDLNAALDRADYVLLVTPLTEQTRNLFAAPQFKAMQSHARFLNFGRGPLVVEEDLIAALRDGEIAGAALDVFCEEPLAVDNPIWDAPNLIVSPHMSGDFHGYFEMMAEQFVDNLKRYLGGQAMMNVVDKEIGYVPRH